MSSRAGGQRCAPLPAHPHPPSHLHEAPIPPRAIWAQGGVGRSGGRTEPPGLCPPRAPHCAGRCSHITPPGPSTPGPVPAAHRSCARLGPACPLAGFCCSLLRATVRGSDESSAAAGQGQPRALGWGRCSSLPPSSKKKCDVEGAACAGSIPSCHGDAGCILGQSIAGSCVGAPTFLPAAVTTGCVWGQGGGTSLLLGTAQSWTSPQHQPAASGCGVDPPNLIQRGAFGAGGSPGLPRRGHWQRDRSGMVAGGGSS